jgi:hypothetical protein
LQKFRKIPLGGIVGEFWDTLGNFLVFYKLKKIMFEKNMSKKLIRA